MSRRNQDQGGSKPSIAFHMIRHAESNNNKVYGDAKRLYRYGSDDYDSEGFRRYVDAHRRADPHLSPLGVEQADALASEYLNPALFDCQASSPVRILCSPMLRTLLTIRPALQRLVVSSSQTAGSGGSGFRQKVHMVVVAHYHEIEGCHDKGVAQPGMSPNEIRDCLFRDLLCSSGGKSSSESNDTMPISQSDIDEIVTLEFVGFDHPHEGWYGGTGHEARVDAEARAAKYCLWLTDYLDSLMYGNGDGDPDETGDSNNNGDLFDVGFLLPGEELEDQHDRFARPLRRRRTVLAIGHGDFMSVVLKRLVGGYVGCGRGGRLVEQSGRPHRTAFAHYNTGITELEYFGHGRYLVMTTNVTPHIPPERYAALRSGGTLRDGWAFTVPTLPDITVEKEVVHGDDCDAKSTIEHDHVQEQTTALRALYLSSSSSNDETVQETSDANDAVRFVVKRGFQVLAVATYSQRSGMLTDVAIRPTANVSVVLLEAIKEHARSIDSGSQSCLSVRPRTGDDRKSFERMGFLDQKSCGDKQPPRSIMKLDFDPVPKEFPGAEKLSNL